MAGHAMKLDLRRYQEDIIVKVRASLRVNRRVLLVLPTGGGKTLVASQMLHTVAAKGKTGKFVCHRQEILDQSVEAFAQNDVPFGVIAAGYPTDPREPIQLCSIDTLRARINRGHKVDVPDVLIIDEAHHSAAGGWSLVKNYMSAAKQIGLSATPRRLDDRGLREHFDDMVVGPSVAELIEQGHLCDYRAFIPGGPDLSGVHTQMGDYVKGELGAAMDKSSVTGDAISHYLKHLNGKRALAFCCSVKHSQNVVAQFREAGVVAWHIDGDTNRGERREALLAFKRGEIKVISNVDLIGEGFNCPGADAAILLRPTRSLALFLQQVGRAMRPAPGKKYAVILDHAGNIMRHGLPCDERQWSLDGREKRPKDEEAKVGVKTCPRCLFAHRAGKPHCPNCGNKYDVAGREVEQVEGVLEEVVDIQAVRRAKQDEQRRARSIEELIKLGEARGYRDPVGWASHYWTARGQAATKQRGSL